MIYSFLNHNYPRPITFKRHRAYQLGVRLNDAEIQNFFSEASERRQLLLYKGFIVSNNQIIASNWSIFGDIWKYWHKRQVKK